MLYIKYWFFAYISLILKYLVAYPLTPLLVLLNTGGDRPQLPTWLGWFDTENPLDGDEPWQTTWRPYLKQFNAYQRYINQCHWLWRNSLHNFQVDVMGVKLLGAGVDILEVVTDPTIQNTQPGKSGLVRRYIRRNGKIIAFHWYYIRQWKSFPDRCIRINLGWKLFGYTGKSGDTAQFTFSPWVCNNYTP
jgi:hypothetical protein